MKSGTFKRGDVVTVQARTYSGVFYPVGAYGVVLGIYETTHPSDNCNQAPAVIRYTVAMYHADGKPMDYDELPVYDRNGGNRYVVAAWQKRHAYEIA